LRCGEVIRQEPREERIGNTVERGDPPQRNPKGRGLLRREFVERLARISRYGLRLSPAHATKFLRRSGSIWS